MINPDASNVFPEARNISLVTYTPESHIFHSLLNRHSSLCVIQRILCYVIRFSNKLLKRPVNFSKLVTYKERYNALILLVKYTQQSHFETELSNEKFSKPFRKLDAFIDANGIIRVGGRLKLSTLPYNKFDCFAFKKSTYVTFNPIFSHLLFSCRS